MNSIIEGNNFEFCSALVIFLERDHFGGHPVENPNVHFCNFLGNVIPSTSTVYVDVTWLRLLPFSLKDWASDWL